MLEVKSRGSVFPFMAQSYKSRIQFPQFDGKCPRERVKMFWFPFCDSTKPRIEAKSIQFISVKATERERDFLGRKSNCMFRRLLPFNVIAILNPFVAALSVLKNALEKADGNVLSVISSDSPENAFILALTLLFLSLEALSTLLRLKAFNYRVGLCSCLSKQ